MTKEERELYFLKLECETQIPGYILAERSQFLRDKIANTKWSDPIYSNLTKAEKREWFDHLERVENGNMRRCHEELYALEQGFDRLLGEK